MSDLSSAPLLIFSVKGPDEFSLDNFSKVFDAKVTYSRYKGRDTGNVTSLETVSRLRKCTEKDFADYGLVSKPNNEKSFLKTALCLNDVDMVVKGAKSIDFLNMIQVTFRKCNSSISECYDD